VEPSPPPPRRSSPSIIGSGGDTGDANGCHLHFELWSGPGWYTGGAPLDPQLFLRAWDAYS